MHEKLSHLKPAVKKPPSQQQSQESAEENEDQEETHPVAYYESSSEAEDIRSNVQDVQDAMDITNSGASAVIENDRNIAAANNNITQTSDNQVKVKKGLEIELKDDDSGEWTGAKVFSRAGKSTGKYKNCWNVTQKGKVK